MPRSLCDAEPRFAGVGGGGGAGGPRREPHTRDTALHSLFSRSATAARMLECIRADKTSRSLPERVGAPWSDVPAASSALEDSPAAIVMRMHPPARQKKRPRAHVRPGGSGGTGRHRAS